MAMRHTCCNRPTCPLTCAGVRVDQAVLGLQSRGQAQLLLTERPDPQHRPGRNAQLKGQWEPSSTVIDTHGIYKHPSPQNQETGWWCGNQFIEECVYNDAHRRCSKLPCRTSLPESVLWWWIYPGNADHSTGNSCAASHSPGVQSVWPGQVGRLRPALTTHRMAVWSFQSGCYVIFIHS
jgi:hypothetical protein